MNQITFNFVQEGSGCGSEDIKKECNVNCFDFFFSFLSLWWTSWVEKSQQLKRTALKYKKKKHMRTGKELEGH